MFIDKHKRIAKKYLIFREKKSFFMSSIIYIGHRTQNNGRQSDPEKINPIQDIATPTSRKWHSMGSNDHNNS